MMERKIYSDGFEKLLKENSDQFKMYPSKKVWHGLYNDLHPGRRWPSITMAILFLFSLIVIGYLNTSNNQHDQSAQKVSDLKLSNVISHTFPDLAFSSSTHLKDIKQPGKEGVLNSSTDNVSNTKNNQANTSVAHPVLAIASASQSQRNDQQKNNNAPDFTVTNVEGIVPSITNQSLSSVNGGDNTIGAEDKMLSSLRTTVSDKPNQDLMDLVIKPHTIDSSGSVSLNQPSKKPEQSTVASSILPKLRKQNLSWSFYLTPSVSSRNVTKQPIHEVIMSNGPVLANNPEPGNPVIHNSLGGEMGAMANYRLSKKLQLISGLQLNYSNYNIMASRIHPAMSTLFLNSGTTGDPYAISSISTYGNSNMGNQTANTSLHNYSFEASVPLGLQFQVSGNDKIQFNIQATFQPSFVIASQYYLLSSDKRSFLTDPDLLRKWNMNTGLSTFLSFNTNKLKWQIGPQVRYQVLSTYTTDYPAKDHTVNYGIRFGVSRFNR